MCKKLLKYAKVTLTKPDGSKMTFRTDITIQYKSSEKIPYTILIYR